MDHEQLNRAHGRYQTPAGEERLKRLPPGTLEKRIRKVCLAYVNGELDDTPMTTTRIRRLVEERFERPVSDYGVRECLRRWGRIGAAELGESPLTFLAFTQRVSEDGFGKLYDEWRDHRARLREGEVEEYEPAPGHEASEWTDAEAYEAE